MPINRKYSSQGPYYQYGDSGKKYFYKAGDPKSRLEAKKKAIKQAVAISYSTGELHLKHIK